MLFHQWLLLSDHSCTSKFDGEIFTTSSLFGYIAITLAVNIFGGFLVTQRMLACIRKEEGQINNDISKFISTFYLISGVLFILALRGLSSPETSRQGNFGIIGWL